MKKIAFMTVLSLLSIITPVHAEIFVSSKVSEAFTAAPKGTKIRFVDFQGGNYDSVRKSLEGAGFVLESPEQWFLSVRRLVLVANEDDKKRIITMENQKDFQGLVAPTTKAEIEQVNNTASDSNKGTVRGVFDMDAGVISQGSRLTGSGAGGIIFGMLGGLIGGLVDSAAESRSLEKLPSGVAVLNATIFNKDSKTKKAIDVIITVAADTDEKPSALFEAAIKQYVSLLTNGYATPTMANTGENNEHRDAQAN